MALPLDYSGVMLKREEGNRLGLSLKIIFYSRFSTVPLPMIVASVSQSRNPLFHSPRESTSSFLTVLENEECLVAENRKRLGDLAWLLRLLIFPILVFFF